MTSLLSQLPELPNLPGTEPSRAPLDCFRIAIADQVHKALPEQISLDKALEGVMLTTKGDSDFNVALPRYRLGGKPDDWAKKVTEKAQVNGYIESITQQGGFVHYKVRTSTLAKLTLSYISSMTAEYEKSKSPTAPYGSNLSAQGKTAIVEFSSVNIAKPLHAGHLRSTIIGAFLANLYEANGWTVERWNYLGDWGKQFGLLAVAWRRFGDEQKLETDAVKHLYEIYVAINRIAEPSFPDGTSEQDTAQAKAEAEEVHNQAREFFKGMEDGDEACLKLWRLFRDLSIKKLKKTYARLNIHFDEYNGESQVTKEQINNVLKRLHEVPGLLSEDKGAVIADLTKYKLEKAIIQRKDGTPLYLTRDIASIIHRMTDRHDGKGYDRLVYVIASQQDLHVAQFFKIVELLGYEWAKPSAGKLVHVNFGMVLGMSTRKGTVVFLDDILEQARDNMHAVMRTNEVKYAQVEDPEATADQVGMTAVKIQDMSGKRINNYNFDWARMLSFEGDTGPYLQYNHARMCSVERKNRETGLELPSPIDPEQLRSDLLIEPKARELIMLLATYPDAIRQAMKDQQPSTIVTFCFKLTHVIASAWEVREISLILRSFLTLMLVNSPSQVVIVKGAERDVALARLWM
ncbi:arginyl-tRNA synthetase, partial [Tilletiaria anomala UBC 951]